MVCFHLYPYKFLRSLCDGCDFGEWKNWWSETWCDERQRIERKHGPALCGESIFLTVWIVWTEKMEILLRFNCELEHKEESSSNLVIRMTEKNEIRFVESWQLSTVTLQLSKNTYSAKWQISTRTWLKIRGRWKLPKLFTFTNMYWLQYTLKKISVTVIDSLLIDLSSQAQALF